MKNRKARFAIIGGDFTLRAAMPLASYPRDLAELAAVCDRNPAMLARFRQEHPEHAAVRLVPDLKDVLAMNDVDAVFVMVRDQYHRDMAVAALDAGKSVYLEKPMALSIEDCDAVLDAALRSRGKLFVGHNMRYCRFVLEMKRIIDSGIIGEIQSVWCRHFVNYGSCYFRHWCARRETVNGLLLQKGCHDIDVIHWLAGGYGTRVVGMGRLSVYNRNTGRRLAPDEAPDRSASIKPGCWPPLEIDGLRSDIDVEDSNMILFQLGNGVQCSYEHCMYAPDSERNYTFIGTKGRVENIGDFGRSQIHVFTRREDRRDPDIVIPIAPDTGSHGGSDPNICTAFFDYIVNGIRPGVSPVAARNAVAVGAMGHHSARNGNMPMDIPPVPQRFVDFFGA